MSVYQYKEYRPLLYDSLVRKKAAYGRAYTFDKMAQALRVQRTYLSAVLNGKGHLSTDQLFLASQFLGFTDDEYRFAAALLEWERSGCAERRRRLLREIKTMRQAGLTSESYVEAAPLSALAKAPRNDASDAAITDFYLDFNAQLVHMFLTIERYRKDPKSVRKALGLDEGVFRQALEKAARAGLIAVEGDGIQLLKDTLHLDADSPLYPAYSLQMRIKGLELLQKSESDKKFSFGVLFSSTDDSFAKITARFLEFLKWARKTTQTDEPEQVFQLTFDLVRYGPD